MEFHFIALASHGKGISGGDRIFIELIKRWTKKHFVNLYVSEEGFAMCIRSNLKKKSKNLQFKISNLKVWSKFGFLVDYIARIIEGIKIGFSIKLFSISKSNVIYVYSASDFWMDVFPAVILKLRYRNKIKWIATWYQTAPNPISGYYGGRYRLSALLYFLSQLIVWPMISMLADFVFVNNEDERRRFNSLNKKGKVFVFIGAVSLTDIKKFAKANKKILLDKIYDGVFQGRFHPQKGVVELVEIWGKVVEKIPNAKLVMIGDGPLMHDVRSKIKELKLEKNIKLLGYVFDGIKKYKTFAQSKVVVHPAFYDSGGMAAAEAMAFGNPCVGFDLLAYKSYYPRGMVKAKSGDKSAFAKAIINLLVNNVRRKKIAKDAIGMIQENWSWDKRASQTLNFVFTNK